jgi:hypothetical protein
MQRFNSWLADKITKAVATMWCAYIFAALALISLPAAISSHNVVVIVAWIAQTFLQLVLLSIILVGQSLHADKQDEIISQNKAIHAHLGIKHHWSRKGDV